MIIGYDFHPQFIEAHPRLFLFTCEQESIAQHAAIIFLILPLHKFIHFGITNQSRTSEEVSQLTGASSRWLLASNSVSLQLTPFRGSHSGTKFPEGFPRKAEPPSDL